MIERVIIGPLVYEVEFIEDLMDDETGLHVYGEIYYKKHKILLDAAMSEGQTLVTLWHEVLHGIMQLTGHKTIHEGTITALAQGIVTALKDNPILRGDNEQAAHIPTPEGVTI